MKIRLKMHSFLFMMVDKVNKYLNLHVEIGSAFAKVSF